MVLSKSRDVFGFPRELYGFLVIDVMFYRFKPKGPEEGLRVPQRSVENKSRSKGLTHLPHYSNGNGYPGQQPAQNPPT